MSAKLRGKSATQPASELTRLKRLWLTLDESARDSWRSRFASEATQAQLRAELRTRLKINLAVDKQLTGFRQWLEAQDARDAEAEMTAQDEAELIARGMVGDVLRKALIEKIQRRAYLEGDPRTGLAAVDRDLKAQQVGLDSRKVAVLEKKAAAFDQAKEVVQSKLTPEEQRTRLREILK